MTACHRRRRSLGSTSSGLNGRRVDSFLLKSNAMRAARELARRYAFGAVHFEPISLAAYRPPKPKPNAAETGRPV